jgi:hypothetical protein
VSDVPELRKKEDGEAKGGPISLAQQMHDVIAPLIEDHSFGIEVVGFDVTYGHAHITNPQGLQIIVGGYLFNLVCRGALLGKQYNLINQDLLPLGILTEKEAIAAIQRSSEALRGQKARQAAQMNSKPGHRNLPPSV